MLSLLKGYQRVLVAFSGGCDSTFLLAIARRTLGKDNVLAVTAFSDSLTAANKDASRRLARELDADYLGIQTNELNNPFYAANPANRCFFCKDELFQCLAPLAEARRMVVVDGFNATDRFDYRPGLQAALKWRVAHPLDAAGLAKRDIRVYSRWLGLETWNKPSSPCLASRIPYGSLVSRETLRWIEQAEEILHAESFRIVRVRHYGPRARIEVPLVDLSRLLEPERWERITRQLQAVGYRVVEADPRGFQSGRLNESVLLGRARVR